MLNITVKLEVCVIALVSIISCTFWHIPCWLGILAQVETIWLTVLQKRWSGLHAVYEVLSLKCRVLSLV